MKKIPIPQKFDLAAEIAKFNENLRFNTSQVAKLRTEIKTTRAVEEKNQAFLQDIIKELLKDKTEEKKQEAEAKKEITEKRLAIAKLALEWGVKIAIVCLLGGNIVLNWPF